MSTIITPTPVAADALSRVQGDTADIQEAWFPDFVKRQQDSCLTLSQIKCFLQMLHDGLGHFGTAKTSARVKESFFLAAHVSGHREMV